MVRYLPWKNRDDSDSPPPPPKRQRLDKGKASASNSLAPKWKGKCDEVAPVHREDDYMRPGFKGDDRYIMVEDELLQIAHSFTAKLHHAELERLQKQLAQRKLQRKDSQSQSQESFPIKHTMSKHQQIINHRKNQTAAIQRVAAERAPPAASAPRSAPTITPFPTGASWDPTFSNSSLGKLMTGGSQQRIDSDLPVMDAMFRMKARTRAAAGFTKASNKKPSPLVQTSPSNGRKRRVQDGEEDDEVEDDDDEDGDDEYDSEDLDMVPVKKVKSVSGGPRKPITTSPTPARVREREKQKQKEPERTYARGSVRQVAAPATAPLRPPPPKKEDDNIYRTPSSSRRLIPSESPKSASSSFMFTSQSTTRSTNTAYSTHSKASSPPTRPVTTTAGSSTVPKKTPLPPLPPTPRAKPRKKLVLVDSDSDGDYADKAQAERWRRRREMEEAKKLAAES